MVPELNNPDNSAERRIGGETLYTGRVVTLQRDRVALADGRETVREVVRHPGAAALLAETSDGRWVMVRQHRYAVAEDLLEIPAGTIEPPESPESCARREIVEETGHRAVSLDSLGSYLPAPGYSDEVIHLFHARVEPAPGGGTPDADEAIRCEYRDPDEVMQDICNDRIRDGKTIAACCRWFARRRKES
jgi:ADP-ribose pyrophosphatase